MPLHFCWRKLTGFKELAVLRQGTWEFRYSFLYPFLRFLEIKGVVGSVSVGGFGKNAFLHIFLSYLIDIKARSWESWGSESKCK